MLFHFFEYFYKLKVHISAYGLWKIANFRCPLYPASGWPDYAITLSVLGSFCSAGSRVDYPAARVTKMFIVDWKWTATLRPFDLIPRDLMKGTARNWPLHPNTPKMPSLPSQ